MVAANRAGGALLAGLVGEVGEDVVHVTMVQLQRAAAAKVARELAHVLRLDPAHKPALDRLVQAWAADYPDKWWDRPMNAFDRGGVYETARLRDAAYRQLKLYREMLRTMPLTADQRQALIRTVSIRVPFRR